LARAPSFADRLQGGGGISSPSARELYYANKGQRADDAEEEIDGRRAQQLLRGTTSKAEKALTGEVSDLKDPKEVVQDDKQGQTRGIRYSFVRRAADGKDEVIDITRFSGRWSELQMAIEPNVSGHLYVLTSFGKGKWQWMRPESLNIPRSGDGAIQVKAYQPVNFALSQVTNTLGKPVVSSIKVLLSYAPLTDLGKWLGDKDDMSEVLIERAKGAVFVVDTTSEVGPPFKMEIFLK
jgi:hypothetical protein